MKQVWTGRPKPVSYTHLEYGGITRKEFKKKGFVFGIGLVGGRMVTGRFPRHRLYLGTACDLSICLFTGDPKRLAFWFFGPFCFAGLCKRFAGLWLANSPANPLAALGIGFEFRWTQFDVWLLAFGTALSYGRNRFCRGGAK